MPNITFQQAIEAAVRCLQCGKLAEADLICRQVLAQRPDCAPALQLLGRSLEAQGQTDAAIELYRKVCDLVGDAESYFTLATALRVAGRFEPAIAAYRMVLRLQPDSADAHNDLGVALAAVGRIDQAIAAHQRAIELRPDWPDAHSNLGICLMERGQLDPAIAECRRAVQLKPDMAELHSNLGYALRENRRLQEAIAEFSDAIRLQPDSGDLHLNRAYAMLLRGDYQPGWAEYEWRWKTESLAASVRNFPQPRWTGQPIQGRMILLYAEQGLGDMLLMLRYLPLLAARGGRVIFETPPQIHRMAQTLSGIDRLLPAGEALPPFDFHCPLMSLPLAFDTRPDTIPADVPYLKADPLLVQHWADRLQPDRSRLNVGLVWSGDKRAKLLGRKSMDFSALAPLAQVQPVRFFGLQLGSPAEQAAHRPAGMDWTDLNGQISDVADTAAILANLDLVITVDTAVANLAGAMGRTDWVLLPFAADWRWTIDQDRSPWYPTLRLFRQTRPGDWTSVIEHAKQALVKEAKLRCPP